MTGPAHPSSASGTAGETPPALEASSVKDVPAQGTGDSTVRQALESVEAGAEQGGRP